MVLLEDQAVAVLERVTCCHHWVIQPADGPVSLGVCQNCFDAREFKNSIEDWDIDKVPVGAHRRDSVEDEESF